jgi:hypothetical protein
MFFVRLVVQATFDYYIYFEIVAAAGVSPRRPDWHGGTPIGMKLKASLE